MLAWTTWHARRLLRVGAHEAKVEALHLLGRVDNPRVLAVLIEAVHETILEFGGWATIAGAAKDDVCLSNTGCAAMLGLPNYDLLLKKDQAHRDGLWEGSFFSKTLKNMPGAWHATRDPG